MNPRVSGHFFASLLACHVRRSQRPALENATEEGGRIRGLRGERALNDASRRMRPAGVPPSEAQPIMEPSALLRTLKASQNTPRAASMKPGAYFNPRVALPKRMIPRIRPAKNVVTRMQETENQ